MKKIIFAIVLLIIIMILAMILSGGEKTIVYTTPQLIWPEDFTAIKAREVKELNEYALIDSPKGIYRIPIDSAIKIYIEENSAE